MRIVIVGIGKVGRALAEHLSREGHDVAVIDNRPGMAERLAEELDVLGIEGNGAAYTVQQQARASQADLVIAATSEDEVNMIACMTAKKLGAKNTIARVRSVEYESQLRFMQQEMGLSLSINPERETARDIARILRFPAVAKVETFAKGRVELVEYHIPQGSLLDGMALKNVAASLQVKVLACAGRGRLHQRYRQAPGTGELLPGAGRFPGPCPQCHGGRGRAYHPLFGGAAEPDEDACARGGPG